MLRKLTDGRYRIDFRDRDGNRFRKIFERKGDAQAQLDSTKEQIRKGEFVSPRSVPCFAEVADDWLAQKSNRRHGTVGNWRAQIELHLKPEFGERKVNRISDADVEAFQVKKAKHLKPRTVAALRTTLASILDLAIKRKMLFANPVRTAERPFAAARELSAADAGNPVESLEDSVAVAPEEVLNPSEIKQMLAHARPGLYHALFATAALTGARSGELFALRWSDVQLGGDEPSIFIRRSLTWARREGEEGRVAYKFYPPKSKKGVRAISIPPELVSILRVWKLRCPLSGELDLVFCTPEGLPIRRSNALRYGLWPALSRAGLHRVNMHSLRHSHVSALIANGAAITEVSARLGHSSPKITLDTYVHWFPRTPTGSVATLASAIFGPTETTPAPRGQFVGTDGAGPAAEAV